MPGAPRINHDHAPSVRYDQLDAAIEDARFASRNVLQLVN
jgi:hypothetical protein